MLSVLKFGYRHSFEKVIKYLLKDEMIIFDDELINSGHNFINRMLTNNSQYSNL